MDNIGKINSDTTRNYYLKDHLGSVRVVLNSTNGVISAQDYDCWGYQLENRTYNSSAMKYDFTGKERDDETSYDYFGARYYDSRIGRWGQVEPLLDKYVNISPYCYSVNNPINSYDPNGKDPRREHIGNLNDVISIIERNGVDENGNVSLIGLHKQFKEEKGRYIYTEKSGIIDMKHFFASAYYGMASGFVETIIMGASYELFQEFPPEEPSYSAPEDPQSNYEGASFGAFETNESFNVSLEFIKEYLGNLNIVEPSDPSISPDKVYIPSILDSDKQLPKRSYMDFFITKPYWGSDPLDQKTELNSKPN